MQPIENEYDYRPKWTVILLGVLFSAMACLFFVDKARTNARGLLINGIIELSPSQASVFFWILAGTSAAFVAACAFLIAFWSNTRQRIALSATSLIIPLSRWSAREISVDYGSITALKTTQVGRQKFLKVSHPNGSFTIAASMLPYPENIDEILRILSDRRNSNLLSAKPGQPVNESTS